MCISTVSSVSSSSYFILETKRERNTTSEFFALHDFHSLKAFQIFVVFPEITKFETWKDHQLYNNQTATLHYKPDSTTPLFRYIERRLRAFRDTVLRTSTPH
jgi:hypothetical protein